MHVACYSMLSIMYIYTYVMLVCTLLLDYMKVFVGKDAIIILLLF